MRVERPAPAAGCGASPVLRAPPAARLGVLLLHSADLPRLGVHDTLQPPSPRRCGEPPLGPLLAFRNSFPPGAGGMFSGSGIHSSRTASMRASLAERRRNERERASSLDVPRKFSISQRRERRESARASTSSSACSGGEAERRREAWKAGDVRVGAPNDMGEGGRGGEGGWEERERGRQREQQVRRRAVGVEGHGTDCRAMGRQ